MPTRFHPAITALFSVCIIQSMKNLQKSPETRFVKTYLLFSFKSPGFIHVGTGRRRVHLQFKKFKKPETTSKTFVRHLITII